MSEDMRKGLWSYMYSIAVSGNLFISLTLYFLGNTNELRNFASTTQQRKFFICSFECGLLLVLETKWLSGMLRWQRVAGRVRDCVHSHRVVLCVGYFWGEYALSPFIWTRSEIWASVSRAELRSDRHSQVFGVTWSGACRRHAECIQFIFNWDSLYEIHKLDGSLVECPCCRCWCCYVKKHR